MESKDLEPQMVDTGVAYFIVVDQHHIIVDKENHILGEIDYSDLFDEFSTLDTIDLENWDYLFDNPIEAMAFRNTMANKYPDEEFSVVMLRQKHITLMACEVMK